MRTGVDKLYKQHELTCAAVDCLNFLKTFRVCLAASAQVTLKRFVAFNTLPANS